MRELILELLSVYSSGNDSEALHLLEKIVLEYDILNNIIDKNTTNFFKVIELCCAEISRLENENKKLKEQLGEKI